MSERLNHNEIFSKAIARASGAKSYDEMYQLIAKGFENNQVTPDTFLGVWMNLKDEVLNRLMNAPIHTSEESVKE